jgi:hypothetical protein
MKRIFKRSWIVLGIVILVWTLLWFIYVRILNNYEFIINVMMLVIGYCLLINYALITIAYWMVKRLKKELVIKN